MVRLRHTLFQGFPGCVSRVACRALRVPPPSSNRTCGFPASGFRRDCRLGLRRQLRHRRPQGSPAQLLIMLVSADSLGNPIRSLAASLQVLPETDLYVMVDLGKSRAGVAEAKVVGPASQMLIQLPNQHRDRPVAVASAGHVLQLDPLALEALVRGIQVPVVSRPQPAPVQPKRESQKVQARSLLLQLHQARLVPIDLQSHPGFQLRLDPVHQLLARLSHQHDKVIGIAHQLRLGPVSWPSGAVKHRVEPVQVQVGQQAARSLPLAASLSATG